MPELWTGTADLAGSNNIAELRGGGGRLILNRVVCCYADYASLSSAAASHARSLLVTSYPTPNPLTRLSLRMQNWSNAIRGRELRAHLHDPAARVGIHEGNGLHLVMEHHGPRWSIAGFERQSA